MGLSAKLNLYIVNEVISKLCQHKVNRNFSISINLSLKVYNLEENIRDCVEIITSSGLNKEINFYFELTETSFMENEADFKSGSKLDTLLRERNIGLSLDDFGIKHSSINRLFECNFSVIKIDMSFVKKLLTDDSDSAITIIKAILDIAKGLGMSVIAEGIEKEKQVNILQNMGCKTVQGYLFYRPMKLEKLVKIIK